MLHSKVLQRALQRALQEIIQQWTLLQWAHHSPWPLYKVMYLRFLFQQCPYLLVGQLLMLVLYTKDQLFLSSLLSYHVPLCYFVLQLIHATLQVWDKLSHFSAYLVPFAL